MNNPETKAAAEDAVFDGQSLMESWVRKPITILPPTTEAVQEAIGVDAQVAQEVVQEERNLGFGISLINETQIVLDTPLNCLRMMQWLRKMEIAKERVQCNNPERWERIWAPQIGLFEAALSDFPRRTLEVAKELDKEYDLPFPEVF
ncbi:hypothetical protein E6C67_30965 [Azospirillum sp. TSA2s]|uniref:hypothetical protein n=1 Tax=Azospirillum sp. TSA2s TaxID=709810 RepID=UPI0010AA9E9D|nr:hypothetical protein [Azospirillum sp. TSA2s]QCG98114.1 hypothetical protein E6C67_30965 [Azospirillum sp. TSA2s]